MTSRLIACCVIALLGLSGTGWAKDKPAPKENAAPADNKPTEYTPAQIAIYRSNQVGSLSKNDVVNYTFSRQGTLQTPFEDKASITIADETPDGKKNIVVDFLTGENRIDQPLYEGFKTGNPIWMVFLEHDVKEMSEITKGSQVYFRNRIKDGFASPKMATIGSRTVTVGDEKVEATVVTIKPYVGVQEIGRFKQFEQKSYEFVISSQVPGGLYSIKTVTPGEAGKDPVMVETMAFASRSKS